ncbi:hypothetical protein NPIL_118141 [Nephila pilipes]|uniref:Uncharacterized protein n=1 Tax=Nephila pilipes TaxID=299642 RepID=A0A8X6Q7B5_NEPPI|nr:hypothetical protein NPIL_118141 [Nephila pilipes]
MVQNMTAYKWRSQERDSVQIKIPQRDGVQMESELDVIQMEDPELDGSMMETQRLVASIERTQNRRLLEDQN